MDTPTAENGKYIYPNVLKNQNITAKNNIVWTADITHLKLEGGNKLEVFLCIDIHTNLVISYLVSTKVITSSKITGALEKCIKKRLIKKPETLLVIHTDQGTQFTSHEYEQFRQLYKDYFRCSMSRHATPTDNSVTERYNRTFKYHKYQQKFLKHKLDGSTIQETIDITLKQNPKFKSYRSIVKKYVEDLNKKPNTKTKKDSPESKDQKVELASRFMLTPEYPKAYSERICHDPRLEEVKRYQRDTEGVSKNLTEVAAKLGEIVKETPFDEENVKFRKHLQEQVKALTNIINNNSEITREYVIAALSPIEIGIEQLNSKMDRMLPRAKKKYNTQKLRDPMDNTLFPIFLGTAGVSATYQKELRRAQLRICYTILFHVGLRINEIRNLKLQDIKDAIQISQFNLIHFKTNQAHIHILSVQAVKDLKKLENEYHTVFKKYNYEYLFGKQKPIHKKSLIRIINKDLKHTCKLNNIAFNLKSHSFRINTISNLLRVTSVQNAANIIGHNDIRSTMTYQQYALTKSEIQDLLKKIHENNNT
jgi:transposase InsO family protein